MPRPSPVFQAARAGIRGPHGCLSHSSSCWRSRSLPPACRQRSAAARAPGGPHGSGHCRPPHQLRPPTPPTRRTLRRRRPYRRRRPRSGGPCAASRGATGHMPATRCPGERCGSPTCVPVRAMGRWTLRLRMSGRGQQPGVERGPGTICGQALERWQMEMRTDAQPLLTHSPSSCVLIQTDPGQCCQPSAAGRPPRTPQSGCVGSMIGSMPVCRTPVSLTPQRS